MALEVDNGLSLRHYRTSCMCSPEEMQGGVLRLHSHPLAALHKRPSFAEVGAAVELLCQVQYIQKAQRHQHFQPEEFLNKVPASACCLAMSLEVEVGLSADLVCRKDRQVMGAELRVVVAIVLAEATVEKVAADTEGIVGLVVSD